MVLSLLGYFLHINIKKLFIDICCKNSLDFFCLIFFNDNQNETVICDGIHDLPIIRCDPTDTLHPAIYLAASEQDLESNRQLKERKVLLLNLKKLTKKKK